MLKKFRRGQIYYLRGTIAGVRVYESTGVSDARAADHIRSRREAQILERLALGKGATLTFAEAALTYMSAGGECRFLGPLLDHFGADTKLRDIDNAAVERAARALYPDLAPATINRQVITPISAVYNLAADDGYCEPRRFRRRKGDNARLRWLTPEEAERLIGAAAPHILPAIALMIGGGCRSSEALGLEVAMLYQATGEAYLPKTKNGRGRMIALPGRALDMIDAGGLPEVGPICRTPKGKPYIMRQNGGGQISTAFRAACQAAGLGRDVTPHVLRHTWATWFYAQTHDFGGLLDRGGWQKADMANRYRKIAPANLGERLFNHGWDFTRPGARVSSARFLSFRRALPTS